MNTVIIVWALMTYAHGWFPTLEFKDQQKCEAAAKHIKEDFDNRHSLSSMVQPYCVRIEK